MCNNNNNKESRDLREDLQHSSSGNDLERRSLTFGRDPSIRNTTITHEIPSKPNDKKFKIDED